MGSSLISEPRRKRKRTARANASFRSNSVDKSGGNRCAGHLPCLAVLFGFAMALVVGVRNRLKHSATKRAMEVHVERAKENARAHPLALLLEEQHDIGSQAARFADPVGRCLSSYGASEPPAERLGVFTCVADTLFFLRALAESLHCNSVVIVDVGRRPFPRHHPPVPPSGSGIEVAFPGRELEISLQKLQVQARVTVGVDPLPDVADLVLVDAHEDALSTNAWVDVILSLMQVISDRGVIAVRAPRDQVQVTADTAENEGVGEKTGTWYTKGHLWEAVVALACDDAYGVTAAVGGLDGGLVVLRHSIPDEKGLESGCGSNHSGQQVGAATAVVAAAPPNPMRFESLFLWSIAERDATTPATVEAVQAKFGGADAVRKYARRRYGRSACMHAAASGADATDSIEPLLEGGGGGGGGHLRAKTRKSRNVVPPNDDPSQWRLATRECLENHLEEHSQDVRAGFALEMVLTANEEKGVDRQVAHLRQRMSEESGPAGTLLWRALHARAAEAAATGLLL